MDRPRHHFDKIVALRYWIPGYLKGKSILYGIQRFVFAASLCHDQHKREENEDQYENGICKVISDVN